MLDKNLSKIYRDYLTNSIAYDTPFVVVLVGDNLIGFADNLSKELDFVYSESLDVDLIKSLLDSRRVVLVKGDLDLVDRLKLASDKDPVLVIGDSEVVDYFIDTKVDFDTQYDRLREYLFGKLECF